MTQSAFRRFVTEKSLGESGTPANTILASVIKRLGDAAYEPKRSLYFDDLERPFVIPHRGYPAIVPEGTRDGYRVAFSQRWPIMEGGDVQMLADGALVSFHDEALDRLTNATGLARDQTSASWSRVVVDASRWYPGGAVSVDSMAVFFSEIMAEFGGKTVLVVENKEHTAQKARLVTQRIIDIFRDAGILQSLLFNSFTLAECIYAAQQGVPSHFNGTYAVCDANKAAMKQYGVLAGVTDVATVTDAQITSLMNYGLKVIMGPINQQWQYDRFAALGVEGFYSDDPMYFSKRFIEYRRTQVTWTSTGTWGVGMTKIGGYGVGQRGNFIGAPGSYRWQIANSLTLIGEISPIANPTAPYTLEFPITWDSLPTNQAFGPGIYFACTNDKQLADSGAVGTGGYTIRFRTNGAVQIWRSDDNVVTSLATFTGGPAITAGQTVTFKVIVTPQGLRITRSDNGWNSGLIADTTYRGGYVSVATSDLGRTQSLGALKVTTP